MSAVIDNRREAAMSSKERLRPPLVTLRSRCAAELESLFIERLNVVVSSDPGDEITPSYTETSIDPQSIEADVTAWGDYAFEPIYFRVLAAKVVLGRQYGVQPVDLVAKPGEPRVEGERVLVTFAMEVDR